MGLASADVPPSRTHSNPDHPISILYVDDEPDLLEIGKLFLEQSGQFNVDTVTAAPAALFHLNTKSYDAIISDYQMPEMDGIEFLKKIRSSGNTIPFILFTGRGREEVVIQALNEGADFYLQKGGDPRSQFAELSNKIRYAVQQKRAEASIRDHEQREADIINFLPDATFAIDRSGKIIAWNHAIEEMTGVPAAAMLGKGDYEYAIPFYGQRQPILIDLIFEPDDVIAKKYAHILHKKDSLIADTSLSFLKGQPATLMVMASPLYSRQGEVVGAIESIRDITERKKSDTELREAYKQIAAQGEELRLQYDRMVSLQHQTAESQQMLTAVLNTVPARVFWKDTDLRYLGCNEPFVCDAGFSDPADLIGKTDFDMAWREQAEMYRADDRKVIDTGIPKIGYEEPQTAANGNRIWLRTSKVPLRDSGGKIIGTLGTYEDITENKQAEEALRETVLHFRTLFEYSGTAIMVLDDDMMISRVNTEFSHLTGYSKDEVEGVLRWTDIIDSDDSKKLLERYHLLRGGSIPAINRFEFQFITKDHRIRKFSATVAIIPTTGRSIVSFLDCTLISRSEDAFGKNRDELCRIPNTA
jgi:PAS domain S-box-containing protein